MENFFKGSIVPIRQASRRLTFLLPISQVNVPETRSTLLSTACLAQDGCPSNPAGFRLRRAVPRHLLSIVTSWEREKHGNWFCTGIGPTPALWLVNTGLNFIWLRTRSV